MSNADDESAILKQVSEAARLIDSGLSVSRAAAEVGLKRPALYYYLGKLRKGEGVKPVKSKSVKHIRCLKPVSSAGAKPDKSKSVKPEKCKKSASKGSVKPVKGKVVKPVRGAKPVIGDDVKDKSVKSVKEQKQHGLSHSSFSSPPQSRSAEGKFLPGISGNPGGQRKITAEARGIFEDFTPTVAREITKIFTELCEDKNKDYELILTYAKEILDRGLGKPKQAVDLVDTTSEDEEYEFLQEHLLGDVEALRLAAALAHRLEVKSSHDGRAPEPGTVESVPPPPGAGTDPGPGSDGANLSEDNNLDASEEWEE
jgi:hypothetical protein